MGLELCFSYWILALFIASTGYFDLVFIKLFPPSSDNQGTVRIIHQSQNFLLVLKFQDCWMIVIFSLTTTFISTGAIEMSLTILNWPQLFRCSFSRRIKFHTNLLINKNILVKRKPNVWNYLNTSSTCNTHAIPSEGRLVNYKIKKGLTFKG